MQPRQSKLTSTVYFAEQDTALDRSKAWSRKHKLNNSTALLQIVSGKFIPSTRIRWLRRKKEATGTLTVSRGFGDPIYVLPLPIEPGTMLRIEPCDTITITATCQAINGKKARLRLLDVQYKLTVYENAERKPDTTVNRNNLHAPSNPNGYPRH